MMAYMQCSSLLALYEYMYMLRLLEDVGDGNSAVCIDFWRYLLPPPES